MALKLGPTFLHRGLAELRNGRLGLMISLAVVWECTSAERVDHWQRKRHSAAPLKVARDRRLCAGVLILSGDGYHRWTGPLVPAPALSSSFCQWAVLMRRCN